MKTGENILKYGLLSLLVLGWTLNPFMKKQAIGYLNSMEYFVVNFILTSLLAFLFWVYLIKTGKCRINVFKKMTTKEIIWAVGAAIVTIITGIALIHLVKTFEVGGIIPQIQPAVIVLTVVSGYFLFGESLGVLKSLGVLSIVVGMILINMSKSVPNVGKRPWK
jgi:drug/metabolite transporter (DMT)-like permease